MNSCKLIPNRHLRYEVQHYHRCNRVTNKIHFNNGVMLAVVAFVSVFMFCYKNQVLAEETTIVVHQIESTTEHAAHIPEIKPNMVENTKVEASNIENNSTNVELNIESSNTTTRFYAIDFASTQQPDHDEHRLQTVVKNTSQIDEKFYSVLEHTTDINNDIFSNIEENPELQFSPDFLNVHDGYPVSTENLEESIRNSVKSEMELEQNLESSPVLEILKELPEPEIRKTLTADILSLDQQVIEDTSESIIKMLNSDMKNKTTKDARNWEFQEPKTYNNEFNLSSAPPLEKLFKTKEEIFVEPEPVPEIKSTPVATLEKLVNICNEHKTTTKCLIVQDTITFNNEFAKKFDSSSALSSDSNYVKIENSDESSNFKNGESSLFKNHFHKNVKVSSFSSWEKNPSGNSEHNFRKKENALTDEKSMENIDNNQRDKTTFPATTSKSDSSENAENFFKDVFDKTSSENVDLTISETSHELHSEDIPMFNVDENDTPETKDDVLSVALNETYSATLLNTTDENCVDNLDARGIATLNEDDNITAENKDAALPVVLNETISASFLNPGDENRFSIEEKHNVSLKLMKEEEMDVSTEVLEEFEHVVIKKVLDVQEICDNIVETTVIPLVQKNDLKSKVIEEQRMVVDPVVKQIVYDDLEYENKLIHNTERQLPQDEKTLSSKDVNDNNQNDLNREENVENQSNFENAKHVQLKLQPSLLLPKYDENSKTKADAKNSQEVKYKAQPYEILVSQVLPSIIESGNKETTELLNYTHFTTTTASSLDAEVKLNSEFHTVDTILLEYVGRAKTIKGSRSVSSEMFSPQHEDDSVAALFETYPPRDAGQTLNDNLADEYAGIGKALPMSFKDGSNRPIIIIVLSSGTAFFLIVISVTIFLISFQRQHGTLDIEMQERSCGKDDLDEEDAETSAKLLEVELSPSVAITLDETEECL